MEVGLAGLLGGVNFDARADIIELPPIPRVQVIDDETGKLVRDPSALLDLHVEVGWRAGALC